MFVSECDICSIFYITQCIIIQPVQFCAKMDISNQNNQFEDNSLQNMQYAFARINSENISEGVIKKSANVTESVCVPSSEHVAEIVGRQGNGISQRH